jgi:DNA-binding response OmpR family regulator
MIVLVVEDDSELRALLQQVLAPEFAVRACACEAEARRLLESEAHGVDVLLTHLAPEYGGSERLLERARACPQRIGVVVASEDPALLDAWRGRADAVVPRPYVVAAVRAALRRASWPR